MHGMHYMTDPKQHCMQVIAGFVLWQLATRVRNILTMPCSLLAILLLFYAGLGLGTLVRDLVNVLTLYHS